MPITTSHWSCPGLTRAEFGLGIGQAGDIHLLRLLDLLLGAVRNEDRLRSPEHFDDLSIGNGREIDFDRGACRDGRGVRIHLRDQRDKDCCGAYRANGASGDVKKVAARVLRRRHGRHVWVLSSGWLIHPPAAGARTEVLGRRGGPLAAVLKAGLRVGLVLLAPLQCKRKPAKA